MSASNHIFNDEFNSMVGPALIEVKCQDISLEEMGFILNGPNDRSSNFLGSVVLGPDFDMCS